MSFEKLCTFKIFYVNLANTCFRIIIQIASTIWNLGLTIPGKWSFVIKICQVSCKLDMKSTCCHGIWQTSHEIHLKSVRTTDSSEIIHFLLVFHMESSGFHMKSIKSTNEIHNEIHNVIHIEICSKSKWNLHYLKSTWSPPDLNRNLLDFINPQDFTGFHKIQQEFTCFHMKYVRFHYEFHDQFHEIHHNFIKSNRTSWSPEISKDFFKSIKSNRILLKVTGFHEIHRISQDFMKSTAFHWMSLNLSWNQ